MRQKKNERERERDMQRVASYVYYLLLQQQLIQSLRAFLLNEHRVSLIAECQLYTRPVVFDVFHLERSNRRVLVHPHVLDSV